MTLIRKPLPSPRRQPHRVGTHALRYYERAGLMLDPVDRASSTHRRYSESDIGWVRFLTRLRSTGMPIATIREYTELVRRGDGTSTRAASCSATPPRRARPARGHHASLAAIDIKIAIYKESRIRMKKITLGTNGPVIGRIGLGLMGMSAFYTGAAKNDAGAIRTIQRALELGVTFLDTAEIYGPYLNEELLASALAGRRDEVVIATKFGTIRHSSDGKGGLDGSAANVRLSVEGSLRRLGTDHIDLYYQHRMDPGTPIEETVGALAELIAEGKILPLRPV